MVPKIPTFAFTTASNAGIMNRLTNQVIVKYDGKEITTLALWDTGATGTCISTDVVSRLMMTPTGKKNIQTPSGSSQVNTYLVDVMLPNNVNIPQIEVCDSEIGNQGLGMLIGMDIITKGDFSVSNYNGRTVFSFRIPSRKTTNYVDEVRLEQLTGTHGKGKRKKK